MLAELEVSAEDDLGEMFANTGREARLGAGFSGVDDGRVREHGLEQGLLRRQPGLVEKRGALPHENGVTHPERAVVVRVVGLLHVVEKVRWRRRTHVSGPHRTAWRGSCGQPGAARR